MEKKLELIIEGYNKEKLILANALSQLDGSNINISTKSDINYRLKDIDKKITELYTYVPLPTNITNRKGFNMVAKAMAIGQLIKEDK